MTAIRKIRSAVLPGATVSNKCRIVRLYPRSRQTILACRWRREPDGRLACVWERVAAPARLLHTGVTDNAED